LQRASDPKSIPPNVNLHHLQASRQAGRQAMEEKLLKALLRINEQGLQQHRTKAHEPCHAKHCETAHLFRFSFMKKKSTGGK
jgi:hypothetical protein